MSVMQSRPLACVMTVSNQEQDAGIQTMTSMTRDERLLMTQRTMNLLEAWGLGASDIMHLLHLPEGVKARNIGRFRDEEPFPDDPTVNRRVGYLLRIEEALHTFFPRNPEMRDLWVKRGNRQFGKKAPVAVMVEDGESGMISVLSHLDCTFAWDLTGSKTEYRAA
ncbi:hypothetical protein Thiowin_01148 [Thiorhodovibrio winogradskyi]|uniref:Antitoxin Xre/MbcA/ParS-like toxin-binding domain-containing protein n=2 Tax=Thiorhodovibrio winogradskyi TaxID=77007 RepID=A0ABZ0S9G0_9GAMM